MVLWEKEKSGIRPGGLPTDPPSPSRARSAASFWSKASKLNPS